ncbi:hypothetical protein PPYR_11258 [Photinus pyralis]|uniref:MARVEL domain-containing protein n=1 Tax=Photinus pyralis TaxID=7054 RepID=A0A5N4AAV9_PHOPY|nr:uncharacterized protein LOC116175717 [Photinus pyralis]XP_031349837.1 uncharacterized protein LOC116175717 [Photinus pyralis]KAB0794419.1 hypothetical protein PPYR_11258 [Photinus pyralis]
MSHTVTVTRTTTTTTTSALILNIGYLKTWPGIFKLFQLLLGIVNVGLVGYYYNERFITVPATFFLLMAVTFLVGTFLILLSCLASISTASIIAKTFYEFIYHLFAFILYLAASLTLLVHVNQYKRSYYYIYDEYTAASVIGLIISILYLLSAIFAYRSYKSV